MSDFGQEKRIDTEDFAYLYNEFNVMCREFTELAFNEIYYVLWFEGQCEPDNLIYKDSLIFVNPETHDVIVRMNIFMNSSYILDHDVIDVPFNILMNPKLWEDWLDDLYTERIDYP